MEIRSRDYAKRAREIIERSPGVRDAVTGATLAFDRLRERAYAEVEADHWRRWASQVKQHTLTHLDRYLEQAEERLLANGASVHWAEDAAAARRITADIAARHGARVVVKSKSMLSEEIDLNPHLEASGFEIFESDLGEFILQLLDEAPSHIVGPAIHRSLEDVQQLFGERFGTPPDADPDELASAARTVLREAFLSADIGVTGGNFVVAETGSVALIENEGNIRLTTSAPPVHVALVGIEKLVPRWSDLPPFLELTTRAATGQPLGMFVSVLQGPRRAGEPDGPDEMHVVFVDNGRSELLADPAAWEALKCVRCGACLNVCPVYRQTGGHAYGWVYSGPIGAVLNPALLGLDEAGLLPFASSLCGACFDVCPVRIPIPQLLLEWRRRAVEAGLTPLSEAMALKAFAGAAVRPALFHRAAAALTSGPGRTVSRALPMVRAWERGREELRPDSPTFHERWSEMEE